MGLMLVITIAKCQTTAMDFTRNDCGGDPHHLFEDLDSGQVILLHFFMAGCFGCPPPAQNIMAMANRINAIYPNKIRGYAFPYDNATSCATSMSWVINSGLSHFYLPMDSGETQRSYYGPFGMPTVVLLAGTGHRIMFSTGTFTPSDTTIMRDSIIGFLTGTSGIKHLSDLVSSFDAFPNPATDYISISLNLKESAKAIIDIADIEGKQIAIISEEKLYGIVRKEFNIANLSSGNYLIRLQINGKTRVQKITINH